MSEPEPTIEELLARLIKLEAERVDLMEENARQRQELLRIIARKVDKAIDPPPKPA